MSAALLRRKLIGELMDSPTLDPTEHLHALEGLRRINQASGTANAISKTLLAFAHRKALTHLTMLDVACGGGDVPVAVASTAKQNGITLHLTLMDRSDLAIRRAADAARAVNLPNRTLHGDAVATLPVQQFDIVTNSLFLHHLTESEVIAVLTHMKNAARRAVIISDLRRSAIGYLIAWFGCRILSRSPVVHYDGPVSVRAAWTIQELRTMATQAGMTNANIHRSWPWRMLLTWERTQPPTSQEGTADGQ